jgi:hypothetical protein
MKRILLLILFADILIFNLLSQVIDNSGSRILFQGLVMDAKTSDKISGSQIIINRKFTSISTSDGTFAFYVNRKDTVVFYSLGYIPTTMLISDTLSGKDFIAGIYMKSDTLSIGEVVIVPRFSNIKSKMLSSRTHEPSAVDNAKYNVAVSAYQGRNSISNLNDPASNYAAIRQKQTIAAYEKGGIVSSDHMLNFNALVLIPAAYMLLKGMPQKPNAYKPEITPYELDQIQKKYLESQQQKK